MQIFSKSCLLTFILMLCLSTHAKPSHTVLASDPWPPYYGPDLPNQGFFSEIVRAAFKQAGYTSEFRFMPWQRALNLVKKGKYDGILGAYFKQERTQYLSYSDPVIDIEVVFVAKKDSNIQYTSMTDIEPYKIAYIYGYHYTDEFSNATHLRKVKTYSIEKSIELLIDDKVDLIIGSKKSIQNIIQNKHPDFINSTKYFKKALTIQQLYVPISKNVYNHKQLLKSFNHGLKEIKNNGTFDSIMNKYGL